MEIIINTEKRTIEVPKDVREDLESRNKLNKKFGREEETILSMLDVRDYKVVSKATKGVKDTLKKADVESYMLSIKDKEPKLYEEYVELRDKVVETTDNGKEIKTSFLTIKAWYYKKFPEKSPFKK